MIRDGNRAIAPALRSVKQLPNPTGSVEQTVFCVKMQMDKHIFYSSPGLPYHRKRAGGTLFAAVMEAMNSVGIARARLLCEFHDTAQAMVYSGTAQRLPKHPTQFPQRKSGFSRRKAASSRKSSGSASIPIVF